MRQLLKRLAKITAGYGLVQWAGPFVSLIFTPIILRILDPSAYGIVDYVQSISSAVGVMALFALPQALTAHFNDRHTTGWSNLVSSSALSLAVLIGIPVCVLYFLAAPAISQLSFNDTSYVILFQIIAAGLVFWMVSSVMIASAQAALRVRWGMLFGLTNLATIVASNVLFIIVLRLGVVGMVLAATLPQVLVAIVALIVMQPTLRRPDPAVMRLLLISGATLLPTFAAAWALNVADRLFLVRVVTTEELGFYAIANKVASLLGVAMAPVYAAWTPLALSLPQTIENQQRMGIMSRFLVGGATIGGLGLGLFAQEILLVLGRAPYVPAAPYVGLLVYVHVISALGTVLYALAVRRKQLAAISGTVVAGALINVALNFVLIPRFGLWGATIATVVGYAVPQALLYARLRKGGDVPVPMTKIILAMGLAFAIYVVSLTLSPLPEPAQIALKLVLLLAFPLGLVGIGIVTRYELRQGLAAVRQRLSLKPLRP